jgi:hypothetical protein
LIKDKLQRLYIRQETLLWKKYLLLRDVQQWIVHRQSKTHRPAADMISVQQHGPARRTFEEDDEEETLQFVDPASQIELTLTNTSPVDVEVIVFADCIQAKPFADTMIQSLGMVSIGHVAFAKKGAKLSTLYTNESNKILLVVRHTDIPSELAYAYSDQFSRFQAVHTIVMSEYNLISYTGAGEEGELRRVSTTSCTVTDNEVPQLESEHVVSGVAAAVLNQAEARSRSAVVYATLSRAYLTVPAMRSFEAVAAALLSLTGAVITAPPASAYAAMLKRDPYVLKTENMYS